MIFGLLRLHLVSRLSAGAIVCAAALAALPREAAAQHAAPSAETSCAAHGSHSGAMHHAPDAPAPSGPAVAAGAKGGCSHCAVTTCVFLSPCGAAGTALVVSRTAERLAPRPPAVLLATWRPSRSRTQEPPTPPPHPLLS